MKIYYDNEYTEELQRRIYEKFMEDAQDRTKVHLSDLCHCPVKCWCRLSGIEPTPPNDVGVGVMMIGVIGQGIIQSVYPEEWSEWEPDKDKPEEEQIPSHIDIFVQEEGSVFPVEIKWSRKNIYRGSDIPVPWILQTTGYMARTGCTEGKFVVFNVMNGTLTAFKVLMTEEELVNRNKQLENLRKDILTAVENGDPSNLEPNYDECRYCPYVENRRRKKLGLGSGCPFSNRKK